MCNIYKNNLIILSQLDNSQFLYYKEDTNKLKIDDRTLSYFRSGTKESDILQIINSSFINMFNNYIINIANSENLPPNIGDNIESDSLEDSIREIKNTKELLRNSLKGLQNYHETLKLNKYESQSTLDLYESLNKLLENIDSYQDKYINAINRKSQKSNKSNSWLYNIYQSTLSGVSKHKNDNVERIIETEVKNNQDEITPDDDLDSNSDEETCECPGVKESESYILGFMYILSRKLRNIILVFGNHIRIIFS